MSPHELRDPEVDDFDERGVFVTADDHVLGLQISMDDANVVGILQRGCDLIRNPHRSFDGK